MTTPDHDDDSAFAKGSAADVNSLVSLAVPQTSTVGDRIEQARLDTFEMESYLVAMKAQLDEEVARVAARWLALERAEHVASTAAPDTATQADLSFEFDNDDSTVWIEPSADDDHVTQQFPMSADEVGAFVGRYSVPGTINHDARCAVIDLNKLRAELDAPGRPIDVVYRSANAGTDIASKRDLENLRDIIRAQCPTGKFVALARSDDDYWSMTAVQDAAGNDLSVDPWAQSELDADRLVQSIAETRFANAWSYEGLQDAGLPAGLCDDWNDAGYEQVIDLDDLTRR